MKPRLPLFLLVLVVALVLVGCATTAAGESKTPASAHAQMPGLTVNITINGTPQEGASGTAPYPITITATNTATGAATPTVTTGPQTTSGPNVPVTVEAPASLIPGKK